MFDKLKKFFSKPEPKVEEKPVPKQVNRTTKVKPTNKTEKEIANEKGEPYVSILRMEIDPTDVNNGSFELDWNDKFIINLIKSGYKQREDDTDQIIVDRWFQNVCRNVALEIYEQQQADPTNRDMRVVRSRDIGDGRTEIS